MTEYESRTELDDAVEQLVWDETISEFKPIRETEIKIFCLICIKTDADDEYVPCKGDPILVRRIPDHFKALVHGHYVLIADYYFWEHASEVQQKAAMFHALMHIHIEQKDDKIKIGMRKPEIKVFRTEVVRFGAYNEMLLDFREAFKLSANRLAESLEVAPK